jgi:hypothetical protein
MGFRNYRFIVLACGFLILSGQLKAQKTEVGFGLGTFNYTGDLVRTYDFAFSKPAATVLFRSNLSNVVSFRTALTGGKISASDKRPIDAFSTKRKASFNLTLIEASAVMEYHFLNWHDPKRILRFSPYMFAGVALFAMSGAAEKPAEYSNVQAAIPFGLGLKYVLNPKWYVALEFGMRKTFFDYLDNVSGPENSKKSYKYGNPFDNDSYYFLGVTLTRTFYTIPCPTSPYK